MNWKIVAAAAGLLVAVGTAVLVSSATRRKPGRNNCKAKAKTAKKAAKAAKSPAVKKAAGELKAALEQAIKA